MTECPSRQAMDEIFCILNRKSLAPACNRVYDFENIRDLVSAREEGQIRGKIVGKLIQQKNRDGEAE